MQKQSIILHYLIKKQIIRKTITILTTNYRYMRGDWRKSVLLRCFLEKLAYVLFIKLENLIV